MHLACCTIRTPCTSPLTAALLTETPSVYCYTAFRYNRSSSTSRLSDGQNTRGEDCHVLCNCTANTRYCDLGEYFQRHANRYLLNRRKMTLAQKEVTSVRRMRYLRRPFCLLQYYQIIPPAGGCARRAPSCRAVG